MKTLIALFALVGCAYGQTYKTVTADTNNVIRTNFTLGASQISGSLAISNVTGLQSALDGKIATNSVISIASGGTGQTNAALAIQALLPSYTGNSNKVLALNSNASSLIWTTNSGGGGSGSVTNIDASGGTTGLAFTGGPITNGGTLTLGGTLNLASGGTGATNASGARSALQLGSAATNESSAFQPASANLTNLANNNGGSLTNVSVDLTTVLPSYSGNNGKVLAVATGGTNVEWTAISNTVTDASTLTNFPAIILQTNSADGSFPSFLLRTNGNGQGLSNLTAANITGTVALSSNVSGTVAIANGGTGATTASNARVNLLPSYTGNSNRILALNSNATDVIWTTNSSGGGGLPETPLAISNGGTGTNTANGVLTNLGILSTSNTVSIGYANQRSTNSVSIGSLADATSDKSIAIGYNINSTGSRAIGIGQAANSTNTDTISIGNSVTAGAAYALAISPNGAAVRGANSSGIGFNAGVASGASNSMQLNSGNNTNANTIQFLSAGSVTTNSWAALANAGVVGTNLLRATNITSAQAAMFTAVTTNAPTNTNAPTPNAWLDIRVGTNDYKLPLWQ